MSNHETRYIPWHRISDLLELDLSNPNTATLLAVKSGVAKALKLDFDNVIVMADGQPIL